MNEFRMEQVPPPKSVSVDQIAETYGLPAGLRVVLRESQYRCSACNEMQPNGSSMVWVPDSVSLGDPPWSVTEAARVNAYNGALSGWCLPCAKKLAGKTKPPEVIAAKAIETAQRTATTKTGFWARLRFALFG